MKCWSRSTLGLVIGILNVLGNIVGVIFLINALLAINGKHDHSAEKDKEVATYNTIFSILIVVCLIMLLITGLFIVGIIKRRHKLMLPWLIMNGIGFIANCGRFLFGFIGLIAQGATFGIIATVFVVGVLSIAISALILWPLYTLYGDIRKENNENASNPTIPYGFNK